MVYSEAFSVAEELAKGDLSEVDIDREIAAERAAAAAGTTELYVPPVPPPVSAEPVAHPEEPLEPKEEPQSSSPPPEAPAEPHGREGRATCTARTIVSSHRGRCRSG
ncbi:hypothetical protein NUW54_g1409 [Trametes sanguinea]|uniref:Uncharacterized protein n=1 Tax=Trametes sanguinea TaxID=158606 RepID=A0ACC1Q8B0_9APHY|nr:hypothetical protein NUW54_g1409 [Trametes sanguinea]